MLVVNDDPESCTEKVEGKGSKGGVASSPARAKNGEAPGTHCLRMRLISPTCGDSGLFSDSSVSCDVRVRTRYSKLIRII